MKIGFFTDSYLPMHDGVATSTHTYAEALKKRGHDVYIIAPKHPRYKDKQANVYRLTSVKFFVPEFRFSLQIPQKSLLQTIKTDFDLIHGHNGGPISFLGWELAKARNIPYVLTYHTMWSRYTHYFLKGKVIKPKLMELTTRITGNRCDYLIAPTERVKRELMSYGIRRPLHVLPTGINTADFINVPKQYIRKKLKVTADKKILLYIGRLGKEKSVDFLIDSFKLIQEQYPNVIFVIVGSGAEKENLKQQVKNLKLRDKVHFLGPIKHTTIAKVYADADVFLFASQTETQGMVILEALASGVPVVSVNDEAFDGLIESRKNGFSVKKDSKIFSEKVTTLLQDETLYARFSQNAYITAERFSLDEKVEQLENIYKNMIKDKAVRAKKKNIRNFEDFRSFLVRAKMQIKSFEL